MRLLFNTAVSAPQVYQNRRLQAVEQLADVLQNNQQHPTAAPDPANSAEPAAEGRSPQTGKGGALESSLFCSKNICVV